MISFIRQHWLFLSILFIGLIIRIVFSSIQGLSNDELSAWYRTQQADFKSLWYYGIKVGDMHPAFYQVLLWGWIKIFGESELAIRSTSFLFFIANSSLLYYIGRKYFTQFSALLVLALYTALTFMVMNTVFARPYNSGIFFLLLSFLAILRIKDNSDKLWRTTTLLVVGMIGAMLSHYFAFMVVGLMALGALFYVGWKKVKFVFFAGIAACLLFLPHLSTTIYHLTRGGLGWLDKPKLSWPIDFIHQFFNNSWILFGLIVFPLLVLLFIKGPNRFNQTAKFSLYIFLSAFIAGFGLSHVFTPILRDLVMLFILPFLFLSLFSFLKEGSSTIKISFIGFLILVPTLDGLFRHKLFEPVHFGNFKKVAETINSFSSEIGNEKIDFAINTNNVAYLNYYLENDLSEEIKDWTAKDIVKQFSKKVEKANSEYFCYVGIHQSHSPQFLEIIKHKYPVVVSKFKTDYSACYMYKGIAAKKRIADLKNLKASQDEFFGEKKIELSEIEELASHEEYYLAEGNVILPRESDLYLVVSIERGGQLNKADGLPYFYSAINIKDIDIGEESSEIYSAFVLPKDLLKTDILKMYYWNPGKVKVKYSDIRFKEIGVINSK